MADTTVNLDASGWSKRNLWRLPSGELAVRPGFRKLVDIAGSLRIISPGAFTVRDEATGGQVTHYYLAPLDGSSSKLAPRLFMADENFSTTFSIDINVNRLPRIITHAVVGDQMLITGPDIPSYFALVGGGIVLATSVASDDTTTTALTQFPTGICTSWVGSRAVIGNGRLAFVSDPVTADGGSPRTFVGENVMVLPGIIYGIHETGDGMLVCVTDQGCYGLDASAAAVGLIGEGAADWRLLNHHTVSAYGTSCVVRGRVYALSRRGFMVVDTENDAEVILNEPMMSYAIGAGRYAVEDFRTCRILPGENGPVIAVDALGAVVFTDFTQNPPIVSWWKTADFAASPPSYGQSSLVGIMRDIDNTPLYVGLHGIYRLEGDFDGTQLISSFSTHHTGSLRGRVGNDSTKNARVRQMFTAASIGGGAPKSYAAFNGVMPTGVVPTTAADTGIVIGTDSWGTATKHYAVTPLSNTRFQFGTASPPTNELGFEVGADSGLARLSTSVGIDFGDSAPERPKNLG